MLLVLMGGNKIITITIKIIIMIWIKYSYGDRGETAIAKTDGNLKGDGDSIKFIDMNGNQYCIFIKDLISIAPKKQWL